MKAYMNNNRIETPVNYETNNSQNKNTGTENMKHERNQIKTNQTFQKNNKPTWQVTIERKIKQI